MNSNKDDQEKLRSSPIHRELEKQKTLLSDSERGLAHAHEALKEAGAKEYKRLGKGLGAENRTEDIGDIFKTVEEKSREVAGKFTSKIIKTAQDKTRNDGATKA